MTPARTAWLVRLAFALAVVAAYWPALAGGFLWDDVIIFMLAKKSLVYFWVSPYQPDYWPVTYSVLFVLWKLFGMHSVGFHLVNVGLHLANVALWDATLRRFAVERRTRLVALALFALHPIQVEAVAYIFQLKTLLGATFFLASLLLYLVSRAEPRRRGLAYSGALLCAFLALFTKTSTAMLPLSLLLAELVLAGSADAGALLLAVRRQWRGLAARLVPFALVAVAGVAVTLRFNAVNYQRIPIWNAGPLERLLTACWNFWFYAWKVLVPWGYTVAYPKVALSPSAWTSYLPLLALAVALALAWRWRRALDGTLLVGVLFFGLNLAPALGFTNVFFMRFSLVADHWAYLSTMGLLLPIAVALTRLTTRAQVAPAVLAVALGAVSWHYASAFADEETLWRRTLAENPRSDLGHSSVALLRYAKGDYRAALAEYQAAIAANERNEEAHFGLGRCMEELGDRAGAEKAYRRAIELNPSHPKSLNSLALILQGRGEHQQALPLLERAIELEPDYGEAHNNLAVVLQGLRRDKDAEVQLKIAAQLRPADASVLVNLGALYVRQRRAVEARLTLERALELDPRQALAHFNLGLLYAEVAQDRARAIAEFEAGLRLQPGNAAARSRLEALRAAQ